MNSTSFIVLILIVVAFVLIVRYFFKTPKYIKPAHIKKEEIFNTYKEQMVNIKDLYKDDEETLKQQKMIFLKSVNAELHKNLFFDEEEIKAVIQELARL